MYITNFVAVFFKRKNTCDKFPQWQDALPFLWFFLSYGVGSLHFFFILLCSKRGWFVKWVLHVSNSWFFQAWVHYVLWMIMYIKLVAIVIYITMFFVSMMLIRKNTVAVWNVIVIFSTMGGKIFGDCVFTQGLIVGEVYPWAEEKGGHVARDSTGFLWMVSNKEDQKY